MNNQRDLILEENRWLHRLKIKWEQKTRNNQNEMKKRNHHHIDFQMLARKHLLLKVKSPRNHLLNKNHQVHLMTLKMQKIYKVTMMRNKSKCLVLMSKKMIMLNLMIQHHQKFSMSR